MPKYVSNGGDWKEVNKPVEITVEDKPVVIEKPVVEESVVDVKEEVKESIDTVAEEALKEIIKKAVKVPKKRTYNKKKK